MVHLTLSVVQKDLRVCEVAAESGRKKVLDWEALVVAPPVVLDASICQLRGVKVDKA
jgi:hypothetical protein